MHCDIDPLHNKYLTHCCCSILTITDIVPAALDHNPTQHSSSRCEFQAIGTYLALADKRLSAPHDTIILAPLKAAPQHSPPAPVSSPSFHQISSIAQLTTPHPASDSIQHAGQRGHRDHPRLHPRRFPRPLLRAESRMPDTGLHDMESGSEGDCGC